MTNFNYYNTANNIATTSVAINLCQTIGPMSMCRAVSTKDRAGCKYKPAGTEECMHFRADMGGACDNPFAHSGAEPPKF